MCKQPPAHSRHGWWLSGICNVEKTKAPARGILRAQFFDVSLLRQEGQLCQTFFALGFKGFRKPEVRVASTAGFGG